MKTTSARLPHGLNGLILAGLAGALVAAVGCGTSGSTATDAGRGGSGGSAGKGGSGGGGGGTGGGSGGSGGGTVSHMVDYEFPSSTQGFILNTFCEPDPNTNFNIAGACATDGGADGGAADGGAGAAPTLTFEPNDGSPANGSLKITVRYTHYNEYVDAIINLTSPVNLTGRTLHAQVKLVSPATFPGGTFLHANAGSAYGNGTGGAVTSSWTPITFDPSVAAGFDATMVNQIGVQFYSGSPPATNPATFPIDAVFGIDTITD